MAAHQIRINDEAERVLASLMTDRSGDVSQVIQELLLRHKEDLEVDEIEAENEGELQRQKEQAERDFAEGRVHTLEEVLRRCGL